MATITRNRTIRPSSRLETSKSYKIDTENVSNGDTLIVNIDHETKSFNKSYTFNGHDVKDRNSINFRVSDYGTYIDISWSGATPQRNTKPEKLVTNKPDSVKTFNPFQINRIKSDEAYILNLCDEILKLNSIRQAKFDFLRGDAGTLLPCDAYYPDLNLVIEYREKQHTEEVKFFDRKQTVSGVGRGEQRRIYDQLRRDVLPQNGITLVEIGFNEFEHDSYKRLIRNKIKDIQIILNKLNKYIK